MSTIYKLLLRNQQDQPISTGGAASYQKTAREALSKL
jgi:hypothetical protein